MCGITGFIKAESLSKEELTSWLDCMNTALTHRGPDDAGLWVDEKDQIALAQRRLSIIDVSKAGHQPMHSQCGRWVMVYNGETHSDQELRPLLKEKGVTFRGHSDTETMLEACAVLGVTEATQQFIGMFAFALWDTQDKRLYLVRDRIGIKPLYWSYHAGTLAFASELKAFRGFPVFPIDTDQEAMALYLRYGYIPAPYTIYKYAKKLMPGTILSFKLGEEPKISTYWSLKSTIENQRKLYKNPSKDEMHTLLKDAVKRSMVSDVPLGAFLSGGIDSSLVVSLMQSQSSKPIKTFTIGFSEKDYDEAPHALAIARHLGTEHTELYVTPKETMAVIPKLAMMYDEPFADISQIPTFLVAQLARQQVTVALSGDGGDEVFAGYNRYLMGEKIWQKSNYFPAKKVIGKVLSHIPHSVWKILENLLPSRYRALHPADRIAGIIRILSSKTPEELYLALVSVWPEPKALLKHGFEPKLSVFKDVCFLDEVIEKMQYIDTLTYLPDDVLTKVDRATMANSLEARVPLLDHRVVAAGWRYSSAQKIHKTTGKLPLRQILTDYIPDSLFERPKTGFSVPVSDWLKGPLRDWAESLLSDSDFPETIDPKPVRKIWQDHVSGKANHKDALWTILMLNSWHKQWKQ